MAKRRQEIGESSARQEGRRRKLMLNDSSSEQSGNLSFGCLERGLLSGDDAVIRYVEDFSSREVKMERAVNIDWLQSQETLNLGSWLNTAGWKDLVSVKEPVFQRLVRILYANLDPNKLVSSIGAYEFKLDETAWRKVFNLPTVSTEEEAPIKSLSREEIFHDILGGENLRNKIWINTTDLPKEADDRLAMSIIIHTIIPRYRNKDQIKEREGRILYALKHGMKFDIGREIVNHIRHVFSKKSLPLCLAMHLMRIMQLAKVDVEMAGSADVKKFTPTSLIDGNSLSRLGFKKDHIHWVYVRKEKGKLTSKYHPAACEEKGEEQDEQGERQQEDCFGHEESTPPSTMPGPSTSTRPPPTTSPHLTRQLNNLQASVDHLSAHITEQIAYLSATIHSKLESMDSKLENLQTRVQSCETKLDHLTSDSPFPSPTYSPNYSPSYSPSSPSYSPPTTPIEISSDSQPQPLSVIPPRPIPHRQNPHPSN